MKLFTIGDSVSQGFMSLAAAQSDNAYSTLIAKKLGLTLNSPEYRYADWNNVGIPLDIEYLMRELQSRYGSNIGGFEWVTVAATINRLIDRSEDYYERGDGRADNPYDDHARFFNNVAVWGFEVADAFQVTPRMCREIILNTQKPTKDNLFSLGPDNAMYRTALKVLNPSLDPKFDSFSQIEWLRLHATGKDQDGAAVTDGEGKAIGEGVENLILWLGSNNALGTVLNLRINQTPNGSNGARRPYEYEHVNRSMFNWNLWHPEDFRADYQQLIGRVDAIMKDNLDADWKVFVATVPLVTIAPIAKGIGETTEVQIKTNVNGVTVEKPVLYYKYYTYFPFEDSFAMETGKYLTMQDALHIDNTIRKFNEIIESEIATLNRQYEEARYIKVDTCKMLEDLAYKRNAGQPPYQLPTDLEFLYPPVNTKYYHADTDGKLKQGGLFSLDGVHPTAIGHGIIAFEFLKEMVKAGVNDVNGNPVNAGLDWKSEKGILQSDLLYSRPLRNMQEIYGKDTIAGLAVRIIDSIKSVTAK